MSAELITNGFIGLLMLGLMWQQNRILRMQNEILAHEAGIVSNSTRPTYRKYWPMLVMGVLMLLTWGAVAADHYDRLYHPKIVEKTVTVTEPYAFAWQGDKEPSKQVIGKHFLRERVLLDDTAYINCTFTEVTFVYNGTATFHLDTARVSGFEISSDNPSIEAELQLLYGLDTLRLPLRVKDTGKPPVNVTPMRTMPQVSPAH